MCLNKCSVTNEIFEGIKGGGDMRYFAAILTCWVMILPVAGLCGQGWDYGASNPVLGWFTPEQGVSDIVVKNGLGFLYGGTPASFQIVDFSTPANPVPLASLLLRQKFQATKHTNLRLFS